MHYTENVLVDGQAIVNINSQLQHTKPVEMQH
jgi:hypothetical protein